MAFEIDDPGKFVRLDNALKRIAADPRAACFADGYSGAITQISDQTAPDALEARMKSAREHLKVRLSSGEIRSQGQSVRKGALPGSDTRSDQEDISPHVWASGNFTAAGSFSATDGSVFENIHVYRDELEKAYPDRKKAHAVNPAQALPSVQPLHPSTKRGPKEGKREGVEFQIWNDLADKDKNKKITAQELREMKQDALSFRYGCSRETACKARDNVLSVLQN